VKYGKEIDMPVLLFAFAAGEFLDEELAYRIEKDPHDPVVISGWEVYNPYSSHPFEWWGLW
jgi:hypothetical protein